MPFRKIPSFIPPMLATLVKQPFDDENWIFEIKFDGYRALAFIDHKHVQLKSRNNQLWNAKFPTIIASLEKINSQVIFDGELVVLDMKGKSHFQWMQNYQKQSKGNLYYYVFDLLYKDGKDLREFPLIERKALLKKYVNKLALPYVRFSQHLLGKGKVFFKHAVKAHLEGIIGKRALSTYQSRRSLDWVKIKNILRQEVVIGGFTQPKGSRTKFGALLVGVYNDQKELNFIGRVGGGFDTTVLQEVYRKLKPLIQKKNPFKNHPKISATWVKPQLVCEVSFTEWTQNNHMRHPIFQGLRIDKRPKDVQKEIPKKR